jgi:hypothetical protein
MGSERCEIILNDVFGGELINATILLFQGLTSVRFGFMDGQGRMAAIHYYERKITPYMDGTVVPLSKTMDLRQARKRWTIQNTGTPAMCYVITDVAMEGPVTANFLSVARSRSKAWMDTLMTKLDCLNSMTPSNLSDCLCGMIDAVTEANGGTLMDKVAVAIAEMQETTKETASEMQSKLAEWSVTVKKMFLYVIWWIHLYDKHLSNKVFEKMNMSKTKKYEEEIYVRDLFKKVYDPDATKSFPSLFSKIKRPSPEVTVLMLTVGTALADPLSRLYLRQCMNKEWVVPILESEQVEGVNVKMLHPATFVNTSGKKSTYLSEMHNVRKPSRGSCCCCIMMTHVTQYC